MIPSAPRKFTLIDAMALIAATGIALVAIRYLIWESWELPRSWSSREILNQLILLNVMLAPLAYALSVAITLLRMRKPRPRLRRVFKQPGAVAGTAVTMQLFCSLLLLIGFLVPDYLFPHMRIMKIDDMAADSFFGFLEMSTFFVPGVAIAAVWTILRLNGSWRPERSWIDRAGRALGLYFILNAGFLGLMYRVVTY